MKSVRMFGSHTRNISKQSKKAGRRKFFLKPPIWSSRKETLSSSSLESIILVKLGLQSLKG
jgi:hypothetical protein